MVRSVFSKVMWVGRATVFMVGLAVILALVLGVASAAFGDDGDFFKLGQRNVAQTMSTLVKQGPGEALALQVRANQPPLTVNAAAGTATGLSADELDGDDSTELPPRGYARVVVTNSSVTFDRSSSKGINGIQRSTSANSVYCFDLAFNNPHAAVASAASHNNNATIGTTLGAVTGCPEGHRDAAAQTFAGNTSDPQTDVSFSIAFM
jgi:hypothetical protein